MPLPEFQNPPALVPPLGPYSHVARAGGIVAFSGQSGHAADGSLAEGLAAQLEQAIANVGHALEAEGLGSEHVLKITVLLAEPELAEPFEAHAGPRFRELFPLGLPASTLMVVQQLAHPSMLVELDVLAHL